MKLLRGLELSSVLVTLLVAVASANSRILSVTQCQGECNAAGIFCMNNAMPALCVPSGNSWRVELVDTCDTDAGFYCNQAEGGCSQNIGPCHPVGQDGVFVCGSMGVFPDPFNCRRYHLCYSNGGNMVSINMDCVDSAFSPETGDCALPSDHDACSAQQWNCSKPGDASAWPGNSNIYYICVNDPIAKALVPRLFRCDSNQVFYDGSCMARDNPDLPDNPGGSGFTCTDIGLFADAKDCTRYYSCSSNLVAQHLQCPVGTHFEQTSASCVLGSC